MHSPEMGFRRHQHGGGAETEDLEGSRGGERECFPCAVRNRQAPTPLAEAATADPPNTARPSTGSEAGNGRGRDQLAPALPERRTTPSEPPAATWPPAAMSVVH